MTTNDDGPADTPALDTIEFTTPKARERAEVTTPVDLCGEEFTAHRPKDATLFFAHSAVADSANDADRALAMLQIVDAAMGAVDRHRFLERCCDSDDPVTAEAVYDMIQKLLERWGEESKIPADTKVVVEPFEDSAPRGDAVHVVNHDLDLDVVCHPPKDIILHITSSSIATGTNTGQQAWCLMLFLDAALSTEDAMLLNHRMRNPRDDLDLEALMSIIDTLMQRWYSEGAPSQSGNRKQRRAAAASGRKSPGTKVKQGGKKKPVASEPELFDETQDG